MRGSLYDPATEVDSCGIGFVADASGYASRRVLDAVLAGLRGVRHRGAVARDCDTGASVLLPSRRRRCP